MKTRLIHIEPWGRLRAATHQASELRWNDDAFPAPENGGTTLAFGKGRSYGDSCLNPDNNICLTENLNKFHRFNPETGMLTCGAGITIEELLNTFTPMGWFPAVVPGTKFVTVGGAIANDIHGKNHHVAGTWGNHTHEITLLRSCNPNPIACSKHENPELFHATIGGLGLTGIILDATIQLEKIHSTRIDAEYLPFREMNEFFEISEESAGWTHTVAWIDLTSPNGRGVFMRGEYHKEPAGLETHRKPIAKVPCNFPNWAVNPTSIRAFNSLYRSGFKTPRKETCHYEPFFFPLDKVHHWNRVYGSRGFFQYQSVIPKGDGTMAAVKEMLREISKSGNGSPLAVLKNFGKKPKAGLMSFTREGTTLAMDLANGGWDTLEMMTRLDRIVNSAGGRLYPAKDTRMTAVDFQSQYPQWKELESLRDPLILSAFWKRTTQQPQTNEIHD